MSLPKVSSLCDLSISIVSFNTRDLLERTTQAALADMDGLEGEIIIADNASTDGSQLMVRKRFPSVRLIVNAGNRFFATANNQAVAASRGRYVLILNSDVELRPGTLPALVKYLDTHPNVGAATARVYFPDGRLQLNCARFSSYAQMLLDYTFWGIIQAGRRRRMRDESWYAGWDRLTEREIDVAPDSFLMVRRQAIEAVGGFDERLRLYFTEDDWCWRIKQAGFRIMYVPVGKAVHPESASVIQVKPLARRIYFEDMITYASKYFGRWRAWWLWLFTRPTYWGMALAGKLRGE